MSAVSSSAPKAKNWTAILAPYAAKLNKVRPGSGGEMIERGYVFFLLMY